MGRVIPDLMNSEELSSDVSMRSDQESDSFKLI